LGKIVHETLSQKNPSQKKTKKMKEEGEICELEDSRG
jgi:hypothetical protein